MDQTYMIDADAGSVSKVLKAAGKDLGAEVSIAAFVRYSVGEDRGGGRGLDVRCTWHVDVT